MKVTVGVIALLVVPAVALWNTLDPQAAAQPVSRVSLAASQGETKPEDDGLATLVKSNHRLATGLYAQLSEAAEPDQNVICSPAAALATLATILTAEKKDLEKELRKALDLQLDHDQIKTTLQSLAVHLKKDNFSPEQNFTGLQIDEPAKGGVRVKAVAPNSLADQAGFQVGDRIISIRPSSAPGPGYAIKSAGDFVEALDEAQAMIMVRCQLADGERFVTRRLRLVGQKKPIESDDDTALQVRIMDALWHPSDDRPPTSMLDFVDQSLQMQILSVDFAKDEKKLGTWFSKRVRPPRDMTMPRTAALADMRTAFTNAVMCQPRWASSVRLGPAREISFSVGNRKRPVPAIPFIGRFHVSKNDDFQTVELPCEGRLALALIVPVAADGLGIVAKKLTESSWSKVLGAGVLQDVTVVVPQFDMVSLMDLRKPLSQLGLAKTFGESEGRLSPAILLQQVQARIIRDNTKKASEDAKTPQETTITLDRGFLFVVFNRRTQEVLVLGRLVDPLAT